LSTTDTVSAHGIDIDQSAAACRRVPWPRAKMGAGGGRRS
jgi:hypothetical protein